MDETIRMTVVVNSLVTPLLFEQLRACKSARSRAAHLRALAEAALRQQITGAASRVQSAALPSPPQERAAPAEVSPAEEGFQVLRIADDGQDNNEDASGSLANAFAEYFD